jgi:hypothetical protein
MKTVVRNNQEEPQKDVWYALLTGDEISDRAFSSPLYDSEDEVLKEAMEYCDTAYIVEVKLITKVVG